MKNKKLFSILGVAALLVAGNFAMQEKEVVDAATPTTKWAAIVLHTRPHPPFPARGQNPPLTNRASAARCPAQTAQSNSVFAPITPQYF